ncbi:MAG: hypothetical protein JSW73_03310 [Candidatus Woesearchaeota archaeon]|nr:MAG: hypothetical protein JSW73_03310 [Candidatus Woesearchaeota archaeon]
MEVLKKRIEKRREEFEKEVEDLVNKVKGLIDEKTNELLEEIKEYESLMDMNNYDPDIEKLGLDIVVWGDDSPNDIYIKVNNPSLALLKMSQIALEDRSEQSYSKENLMTIKKLFDGLPKDMKDNVREWYQGTVCEYIQTGKVHDKKK